ncbi:hypothetical protein HanPSC8_Chr16g0694251 [Helianthus annuus]|nr:hypothetical protein HanPSC8_Chr16g0694251 [Helianthus annuus]
MKTVDDANVAIEKLNDTVSCFVLFHYMPNLRVCHLTYTLPVPLFPIFQYRYRFGTERVPCSSLITCHIRSCRCSKAKRFV